MEYLRRLWCVLRKDSVPWARDNLGVASIMAIAPALAVALLDHTRVIDWAVIRAALFLYLGSFLVYAAYHLFRAIRKVDAGHLAEISFLRRAIHSQVAITDLRDDDPRIEAEFADERVFQPHTASLILINRGSRPARMVRIAPIRFTARIAEFPGTVESMRKDASNRFTPELGGQWGFDSHADLIRALSEEWTHREDHTEIREIAVPVQVDYEDDEGTRYEFSFELFYEAGIAFYNLSHEKFADCRNFKYRRMPRGITPLALIHLAQTSARANSQALQ